MKKVMLFLVAIVLSAAVFAQNDKEVKRPSVAKSVLNQKAPELVIEKWLTEKPDTEGKFMLLEFYGFFCAPCKTVVPKLNDFHKKFKKNLVIIGLTSDRGNGGWKDVTIDYYKAVDTKRTTRNQLNLISVPYSLLIDRQGIVRWEGNPLDLTEEIIKDVMKKYKK